ncbi:FAD-binding oxidoreductase [Pelotomaculum propionicicum]|uniref:D-lactate dehydrogenase (cytochrome) n=1 Tax=Pelotomaculum propionicicum TaxID=258475 RepID=A0A4Y7RVR1_9FIRM|nr:FAD-linked oxidase C-terminal domain-containing protein [Pelotomaculum propionicicum]TEB13108.1 putative FAD-linked oxidoreductase [Pelotomaculum propionicicum]
MDKARLGAELKKIFPAERVLTGNLELKLYSYDSSFMARFQSFVPDAVVLPQSTEEVSAVLRLACAHSIPVVPRGAGSGETCGCLATRGGIVLDLSAWDTIEEVDTENMQVFVRPGVVHYKLNEHLAGHGLFFPPDPGSTRMCTIGGMVANNSSGLRAVKYGATEQYVLGLEVVLPDGQVINTGGVGCRALKNVSGLNLTKLFVGSEGILGVITKVRLRVWPRPKARGIAMAVFSELDQAPATVLDVYQSGILPSGIEILDSSAIQAINLYKPEINLPAAEAILIFEVDGNPASVEWEGRQIAEIAGRRAASVEWATNPQRMADLWRGRSVVAIAAARLRADGSRIFAGEDISVPLNRVTESLRRIKELSRQFGVTVVNYGHIGDGNIHTAPVINLESPEEVASANGLVDAIHRLAIELGGSTTGEHGVGAVRNQYTLAEHGEAATIMKRVKKALDPCNIMNPGKLLAPEGDQGSV